MNRKLTIATAISTLATLATLTNGSAFAEGAYLPSPGSSTLTLSFSNQKADEFRPGVMRGNLPADLKQDTFKLNYTYGIFDPLALDVEVGYAKSKFITIPGLAPKGGLKGNTDSRIGVRFRVLDDLADAPVTLTLGAAAIIKGSYDTGALSSIGDGANGTEVTATVAKAFTSNFNGFATVGHRNRQSPVPNESFYKIGVNFNPTAEIGLSLAHEELRSSGKLDIGGPGFTPARFPEVKEEYGFTTLGATFRVLSNLSLGVQYGQKQAKRNTAESKVVGVSLTTSF
jgi:hypothetical protein